MLLFLGKDTVVFITKADEEKPIKDLKLSEEKDLEEMGEFLSRRLLLIKMAVIFEKFPLKIFDDSGRNLPDGSVNFHCPCLQSFHGRLTGPCGFETRESFECFVKSDDPQQCLDKFQALDKCSRENNIKSLDDDDEAADADQS